MERPQGSGQRHHDPVVPGLHGQEDRQVFDPFFSFTRGRRIVRPSSDENAILVSFGYDERLESCLTMFRDERLRALSRQYDGQRRWVKRGFRNLKVIIHAPFAGSLEPGKDPSQKFCR